MVRAAGRKLEASWSVPVSVHEVPLTGRRFELEADAAPRVAIAKWRRNCARLLRAFEPHSM